MSNVFINGNDYSWPSVRIVCAGQKVDDLKIGEIAIEVSVEEMMSLRKSIQDQQAGTVTARTLSKEQLIELIRRFHPSSEAGKKRGWSDYVGGMKDSGDWFYERMIKSSIEELELCLSELTANNK